MEAGLTFLVASALTLFDLDRTFYVPNKTDQKRRLYCWWWGFVLLNGSLAAAVYFGIRSAILPDWPPWGRAIIVGVAYLAVLRAKLTTFEYQGREIPFGPELLYEQAKGYAFKRINRIAKVARYEETIDLANKSTLTDLARRAKLSIDQDSLMSVEDKSASKSWLLKVLEDEAANEEDKKASLANYLTSGQRGS
jgi:hypothetical protein